MDELIQVAGAHRIPCVEIPNAEADATEARIRERYGEGATSGALWECLDGPGWHSAEAWRSIGPFFGDRAVLLLLDHRYDSWRPYGARLESGSDLGVLLAESYWSSVYVCDEQLDALLAYNDHEVLIGCGEASEYVEKLR